MLGSLVDDRDGDNEGDSDNDDDDANNGAEVCDKVSSALKPSERLRLARADVASECKR